MPRCNAIVLACFNSRTLGRVRLDMLGYGFEITLFQFTHPGKGATMLERALKPPYASFNSRTLGRVRLVPFS